MTIQELSIRNAAEQDATAIADLLGQLGYAASAGQVQERMKQLAASPADRLLVADWNGQVVAFAVLHMMAYFHRGEHLGKIVSFVVDGKYRWQGVGSRLLETLEEIARDNGCNRMELTSAEDRLEAHDFYEHRGYVRAGFKFYKPIKRLNR